MMTDFPLPPHSFMSDAQIVETAPVHDNGNTSFAFRPGDWKQDLFTIPLEAAVSYAINNLYTHSDRPFFPFQNETPNESPRSTRYPSSRVFPFYVGLALGTMGVIKLAEEEKFPFWTVTRGWIHAALLTDVGTGFTKSFFQRRRPYYYGPGENNRNSDNARLSFVSGHASQSFSFAVYSILVVNEYVESTAIKAIYALSSLSIASVVSWSRVEDHKHHPSDVLAGAALGAAISYFIWELGSSPRRNIEISFVPNLIDSGVSLQARTYF